MATVAIPEKYVEVLSALGDLQTTVDLALQRYTIEQITAKITDLRQRDQGYQAYCMTCFYKNDQKIERMAVERTNRV